VATSREWHLVRRPRGEPVAEDFELAEVEVPDPDAGQVLIENAWLSVDPYMRARMNATRSYAPSYELGEPMYGGAVGRVESSRLDGFEPGDWVVHSLGWRERTLADGRGLRRIDPALAPPQAYLGVLGLTGFTAYVGIDDVGRVREGDVVYVSAAAGAVGSAAAQIAKLRGARVLGSAGSPAKAAWLEELGLDGVFDYRERPVREALRELAPEGLDVYFDNVGGDQLEAALGVMRDHGRVVACGSIARYNDSEPSPGPRNLFLVVTRRLRIEGYIISDHGDRLPAFLAEATGWVADGRLRWRETVVDGIERMPEAFAALFHGDNVGKMLVKVEVP
jgi:hypothetical protein